MKTLLNHCLDGMKKITETFRGEPAEIHIASGCRRIMLQQTRVEAVKPFFERFTSTLPTVKDLAEYPQEKLLKLWEGLGYYNRVKNMQKAAVILCEQYDGVLPADYEALKSLPGIGNYTAGAVASIAYEGPGACGGWKCASCPGKDPSG